MQNLINEESKKRNYTFIDNIRCIAMMSIVFEHCFGFQDLPMYSAKFWVYLNVVQLDKFGTVIFFLLAGFLIGDKFTDYTPGEYLKRRFSGTFGPWLFWSLVYVACLIIDLHVTGNMYHDNRFNQANIWDGIRKVYLYTNYWFIINFMVSITLLLIFKRHLYSRKFGAILLCFTLTYCVNIHYEWFDPSHTTAILGFIFFLWLGAQLRKNWEAFEHWVDNLSYPKLLLIMAVTYIAAGYEMLSLIKMHSQDPYNTLRFSNVLFSLEMFVLLLKIKNFPLISYLQPRKTTYGMYLIHYIIVIFLFKELIRPLDIHEGSFSALEYLLFKIGSFVVIYTITILLVLGINISPAKKLVGN